MLSQTNFDRNAVISVIKKKQKRHYCSVGGHSGVQWYHHRDKEYTHKCILYLDGYHNNIVSSGIKRVTHFLCSDQYFDPRRNNLLISKVNRFTSLVNRRVLTSSRYPCPVLKSTTAPIFKI